MAKTKENSQILSKQISSRELKKEYICRVVGKFPERLEIDRPLLVIGLGDAFLRVSPQVRAQILVIFYYPEII